jgi:hypothetical protein
VSKLDRCFTHNATVPRRVRIALAVLLDVIPDVSSTKIPQCNAQRVSYRPQPLGSGGRGQSGCDMSLDEHAMVDVLITSARRENISACA